MEDVFFKQVLKQTKTTEYISTASKSLLNYLNNYLISDCKKYITTLHQESTSSDNHVFIISTIFDKQSFNKYIGDNLKLDISRCAIKGNDIHLTLPIKIDKEGKLYIASFYPSEKK